MLEIRGLSIEHASTKKKKENAIVQNLEEEIKVLEDNFEENKTEELRVKKESLENIRKKYMEGVLIRSKARWIEQREKASSYFCRLEKRNFQSKRMTSLTKDDQTEITDPKYIVTKVKNFYSSLYQAKETTDIDRELQNLIQNLPKLTEDEAIKLNGEMTLKKATIALKNMKNNKSPGADGFTVEFYKFFWRDLGDFVLKSINESYRKGCMSVTQREGLIILIPKGDKSRKQYL
ncbi:LINE-1 reverse transcriptase homolog [Elysia marginata]|uniref:LINE-1 reverse transcriptase homolog n=1 Tax=Elysia marginata TaxID=1093978 RepID=A0AAV4GL43_9GAST|nr:LINE-1 reverse transcriptase homolog [Elysia marginata]